MEIVCNIINVFTVTFDQFNASLIHKSFNFIKKVPKKEPYLETHLTWTWEKHLKSSRMKDKHHNKSDTVVTPQNDTNYGKINTIVNVSLFYAIFFVF